MDVAAVSSKSLVYDLHIHTNFSPDSEVPMEAYAQRGQQLSCHIGFLDHFEYAFTSRPNYLDEDKLVLLLEEFDRVHSAYPNTSLGLEVDFFLDQQSEISEFCDSHKRDFDYFIGAFHVIGGLAVTEPKEMSILVRKFGLLTVLERYFEGMEVAIKSKLFDGMAHLDVVMRFAGSYPDFPKVKQLWENRTQRLGLLCQENGVLVEVNVGGLHQPWKHTYPSQDMIDQLLDTGTHFFVGSDSHTLEAFLNMIPKVREITGYLRERNGFCLPGKLE